MSNAFERTASEVVYPGRFVQVRRDTYTFTDGAQHVREVVSHRGSVAVVAVDNQFLYLVSQPREAVGETDLLEIPAGILDKPGEEPQAAAARELVEEVGKTAASWTPLRTILNSPGCLEQREHLFLAQDLTDCPTQPEEDERIQIVAWPLDELDALIAQAIDAKTLVAVLLARPLIGR
jgi:ADP-ribose pyrophosphatase